MASGTQDPGADPDDPEPATPGDAGSSEGAQEPGGADEPRSAAAATGPPDDDAAWQAIVAHYGDRAVLDDPTPAPRGGAPGPADAPGPAEGQPPPAEAGGTGPDGTTSGAAAPPEADAVRLRRLFEPFGRSDPSPAPRREDEADGGPGADAAPEESRGVDGPFVPPPAPPVPGTTADRRAAWLGALGAPVALLLSLVLSIDLPEVVALGLVAWFVGGFLYLVLTMSREPRDPGDDGARV